MRKRTRTFCALLALSFPFLARAQVIQTLEGKDGGVVTTVEEGGVSEDDYAAAGILEDWKDILEDFREHSAELAELEKEISHISKTKGQGTMSPFVSRDGKTFQLPYIPGDNGENLYLLTREGITVYMAIDAPVYLQDTDDDVIKWVRYYAYRNRARTKRLFSRYKGWEPRIKACFEAEGVPAEIAELCLVESGCTYNALSPAGALGMWQFMPGTGRAMGLTVNQSTDDRKDPVKSTVAAAKLLKRNYSKTNDWTLAVAAYNCGTGHFLKQGRNGLRWSQVKPLLPKETQQYIPGLLAIHYVWTYRNELGFNN